MIDHDYRCLECHLGNPHSWLEHRRSIARYIPIPGESNLQSKPGVDIPNPGSPGPTSFLSGQVTGQLAASGVS